MPIFKLEPLIDASILGQIPQVSEEFSDYYRRFPDRRPSFSTFSAREFPPGDPDLNGLALGSNANPTDLLYSLEMGPKIGLIVSERLREILDQLQIGPHKYFPLSLTGTESPSQQYSFLYLLQSDGEVDYPGSILTNHFSPEERLEVRQHSDLQDLAQRNVFAKPDTWQLRRPLDVFRVPMEAGILTSEHAREILTNNGITGAKISPFTRFQVVMPQDEP